MKCLLTPSRMMIDAGHGGTDNGAVGAGAKEKDVALRFAVALHFELTLRGHVAALTRMRDEFVPLSDRARLANEYRVDAFISLHANASPNEKMFGAWLIHAAPSERGRTLAHNLAARFDVRERSKVYPDGGPPTGHRTLAVLRRTAMPAVLVELGFITNEPDRRMLLDEKQPAKTAIVIADGIEDWLRRRPVP